MRGRVSDRRRVGRAVDPDVRRRRSPSSACRAGCPARAGPDRSPRPSPTAADTTTGSAASSRSRSFREASGTPTGRSRRRTSEPSFASSKNSRRFDPRRITTASSSSAEPTFGFRISKPRRIGARLFVANAVRIARPAASRFKMRPSCACTARGFTPLSTIRASMALRSTPLPRRSTYVRTRACETSTSSGTSAPGRANLARRMALGTFARAPSAVGASSTLRVSSTTSTSGFE